MIDINIEEPLWLDGQSEEQWHDFFEKICLATLDKPCGISILLCNDDKIQMLNKTFRNKDSATNTLSFPCDIEDGFLGDIALSYQKIHMECITNKLSFSEHVSYLTIHSLLHLKGFTHDDEDSQKIMEDKEVEVMRKLGLI